ncbi:MAG: hypothetical protein RL660_304 [Bacteroidota bacterium]
MQSTSTTAKLIKQNTIWNFAAMILAFVIYCNINYDPSMVGWYATFATPPLIALPIVNLFFLRFFVKRKGSPFIFISVLLIVPLILFVSYLTIDTILLPAWAVTYVILNVITAIRLNRSLS